MTDPSIDAALQLTNAAFSSPAPAFALALVLLLVGHQIPVQIGRRLRPVAQLVLDLCDVLDPEGRTRRSSRTKRSGE